MQVLLLSSFSHQDIMYSDAHFFLYVVGSLQISTQLEASSRTIKKTRDGLLPMPSSRHAVL
jgi:hypothetical protein